MTSVLLTRVVERSDGWPSKTSVLPTPSAVTISSGCPSGTTACFNGMVQDRPRQESSSPATNRGSSAATTSCRPYDQSRPRYAYAALWIAGDSECSMGEPSTAHCRGCLLY